MSKQPNRRDFLATTLKTGAFLPFVGSPLASLANPFSAPEKSLNILILGGTSFLGPHQIAYALGRGHSITTFTRGKTKPTVNKDLFEKVENLVGDRANNLEALKGRKWDAVIDNSGHRVQWTKDTAELLKDNVGLYLYTSSTGVYYPYLTTDLKENQKVALEVPEDATQDAKYEYDYGVMKANSELAAQKAFGKDRTIVVRPTYMLGPADRTFRSAYWPVRMSRGGEILVPGRASDHVQFIDIRDMAGFMIRLIENKTAGTFNGVGPISEMGLHEFIYGVKACFSVESMLTMIEDYDFLEANNVTYSIPWVMANEDHLGSSKVNNSHSIAHGLTFRPMAQTIMDIYEWWNSEAVTDERREALVSGERSLMAREAAVLEAWEKHQN